ncbi:hypothetical protein Q4Q34_07500 [Flavivirga abyssicola]|uniref:hypothetical protein n=1 Tax=Flavivirga abyssicola TaxID=3063533 RepID=UPI0026DFCFAB|nr:hypothetical protein [Flavivirga sp. MEBiC07777]WVK14871.1 hypothetical protein Q4Q34_07500 [Flavivirga sp. MEBiC07777]
MKLYPFILFFAFALRPAYNIGYVAYFQLNIDYIIETYCVNKEKPELQCNGKCHLANQLAVNSIDDTEDPSFLDSIFEAFIPVYFHKNTSHFSVAQFFISFKNNWSYHNTFTTIVKDILIPPPQV